MLEDRRRKKADLDVVYTRRGERFGALGKHGRLHFEIARNRADGSPTSRRTDDRANGWLRQCAERTLRWVLEIDNIRAFDDRDFGFRGIGDAGKHQGHSAPTVMK